MGDKDKDFFTSLNFAVNLISAEVVSFHSEASETSVRGWRFTKE